MINVLIGQADPGAIKKLFDPLALGTYTGASAGVWVLSATIRKIFGGVAPAIALSVAMVVAFIGAYASQSLGGVVDVFVTILNGCLLFLTASGINEFAVGVSTPKPLKAEAQAKNPKWLLPWFA